MWRRRFLLDLQPKERFTLYLNDYEGWETLDESVFYYRQHPEYTICIEDESREVALGHQRWARACMNESVSYCGIELKFHQTVLWRSRLISFDGARASVLSPEMHIQGSARENEIFYYYVKDSMKWRLNRFLNTTPLQSVNRESMSVAEKYILTFDNENVLENFKEFLNTTDRPLLVTRIDKTDYEYINETLTFCQQVRRMYNDFVAQRKRTELSMK